jgi:alpha-D-ribose 1-methylphosphonate 5-triphosphate synthase subunit PhnH
MRMDQDSLTGGFAEPVFDSQAVFRAVMDAMARPGTLQTVSLQIKPPQGFGLAQGAIALTLCDQEVGVWLSSSLAKASVGAWIGFHTGATMVDAKSECQFAFVEAGMARLTFSAFPLGTQDYPDRSATLVLELAALTGGPELVLQGPGIRDQAMIAPVGLPEGFLLHWQDSHQQFPRGVDLILTAGRDLICLPRSVTISNREA